MQVLGHQALADLNVNDGRKGEFSQEIGSCQIHDLKVFMCFPWFSRLWQFRSSLDRARRSSRSVGAVHAKPELDGQYGLLGAFQGSGASCCVLWEISCRDKLPYVHTHSNPHTDRKVKSAKNSGKQVSGFWGITLYLFATHLSISSMILLCDILCAPWVPTESESQFANMHTLR